MNDNKGTIALVVQETADIIDVECIDGILFTPYTILGISLPGAVTITEEIMDLLNVVIILVYLHTQYYQLK